MYYFYYDFRREIAFACLFGCLHDFPFYLFGQEVYHFLHHFTFGLGLETLSLCSGLILQEEVAYSIPILSSGIRFAWSCKVPEHLRLVQLLIPQGAHQLEESFSGDLIVQKVLFLEQQGWHVSLISDQHKLNLALQLPWHTQVDEFCLVDSTL